MAIFTLIATALLAGTFLAGPIAVQILAAGLGLATSIGLSYAARALAGNPNNQTPAAGGVGGVQGTLAASGDVPRSFSLGYSVTAGSLVYANTHGGDSQTPNAYLVQVIALSDLPGGRMVELWINGAQCTLPDGGLISGEQPSGVGYAVPEYVKPLNANTTGTAPFLYVKYFDGTQTEAEPFLVDWFGGDPNRPYQSTRVGVGVAYVIVTALVNDAVWTGFPTCKFAVSGVPLYDPSQDSSVGGDGSQRYGDASTWGGDGDNLPAVQIYNVLRGFSYGGAWLYGLQNMAAARLPAANWIAQINKCRAEIEGTAGLEPTYRAGGQINVNAQSVNAVEALLTACQGRISEIGGFYKIHIGAPDSPSFAFSDADILSSEEQVFAPFFALSNSVNGIQATYPDPAQGWNIATAPAYYRTDLEIKDGNRRLMANPAFDFVPYAAQVQRLQKSAIEESQRARTHTIVLPPKFWMVEPGDVGAWTSARNGYSAKQFRADAIVDHANLDVTASLTEIDPADYSWNHSVDFKPVTSGATAIAQPAAQAIDGFTAAGISLFDAGGIARRPAIELEWDGTLPGVSGVQYEVRITASQAIVVRDQSLNFAAGEAVISASILPLTNYQVRAILIPSAPRDVTWSDWLDVTTPDVALTPADLSHGIQDAIKSIAAVSDRIRQVEQIVADGLTNIAGLQQTALEDLNQQDWDHRVDLISQISTGDSANAATIDAVSTVANNATESIAVLSDSVSATFGAGFSSVNTVALAFSTRDLSLASYQVTVSSHFDAIDGPTGTLTQAVAQVTSNTAALTSPTGSFALYQNEVSAKFGPDITSVNTVTSAFAYYHGLVASTYSVTLTTDGYATGFSLINAGAGFSSCVFVADKFEIQLPGYNGNAPQPVFTVGTINGSPAVGLTGNLYLDGTIYARQIVTGQLTSASGVFGHVSIESLSLAGAAVTVPVSQELTGTVNGNGASFISVSNISFGINTAGLAGETISVLLNFVGDLGINAFTWDLYLHVSSPTSYSSPVVGGQNSISSGGNVTAAAVYTFSASGGTDTVTVDAMFFGSSTSQGISNRVLTAVATKR